VRRLPLLSLLVSLCLLALTGATEAGSAAVTTSRGHVVAAVHSHIAAATRSGADRLTPYAPAQRHLVPAASLPAAALVALALAAFVSRRRASGTTPQNGRLAAAGRGPPVTS
jgi:hypothetical protein